MLNTTPVKSITGKLYLLVYLNSAVMCIGHVVHVLSCSVQVHYSRYGESVNNKHGHISLSLHQSYMYEYF